MWKQVQTLRVCMCVHVHVYVCVHVFKGSLDPCITFVCGVNTHIHMCMLACVSVPFRLTNCLRYHVLTFVTTQNLISITLLVPIIKFAKIMLHDCSSCLQHVDERILSI